MLILFTLDFMFEYPFHPFFQKDLFIDDMLNGRRRFCSPLLVNAVLAAAWVYFLSGFRFPPTE